MRRLTPAEAGLIGLEPIGREPVHPEPVHPEPLGLEPLDRRLDPGSPHPVVVAFSGGGDSLALLVVARAWARRTGRPIEAVTVDHGLHPRSEATTARAGEMAQALGVAWRSLAWRGPKPMAGVQAAARAARHALLAEHAREVGARVLLFGHTADDRFEADLMRGTTPALGRLCAWAPSPAWPQGRGVFLLRPLLQARRGVLRAWLAGQGLAWIDDPANADPRFARSRARTALQAREAEAADRSAPPREARQAIDPGRDPAFRDLALRVAADAYGSLCIPRAVLAGAAPPVARRLLAAAILCASGQGRPPRGDALGRLLERLSGAGPFTATLAGAKIAADAQAVMFAREVGDLLRARGRGPWGLGPPGAGAPGASPATPAVFDGRFELSGVEAGWTAAPALGRMSRLSREDAQALRQAPRQVRPSLPVIGDAAGRLSLPAPFGTGPVRARALAGARLAAACGLLACEHDIDSFACHMALDESSPYLHSQSVGCRDS